MSLSDILVTPLARVNTLGGDVLHGMKASDLGYTNFGEAYFSWVEGGFVKAWKRHMQMTMNVVVPVGQVQFVFSMDGRDEFRKEEIGEDRYVRLTVPPGIWFGFQGLRPKGSLVLNIADIPHDPHEIERLRREQIRYEWESL